MAASPGLGIYTGSQRILHTCTDIYCILKSAGSSLRKLTLSLKIIGWAMGVANKHSGKLLPTAQGRPPTMGEGGVSTPPLMVAHDGVVLPRCV